jgi:hypothetical protein
MTHGNDAACANSTKAFRVRASRLCKYTLFDFAGIKFHVFLHKLFNYFTFQFLLKSKRNPSLLDL